MQKEKRNKKILILVLLLMVFGLTGLILNETYSRYISSASGTASVNVAPWIIKLDGQDLVTNNTFTAKNVTWEANANIADGYIAPSRKGTINLVVDPTGTKVATRISVGIDTAAMTNANSQIKVSSVNAPGVTFTQNGNTYSADLTLAQINAGVKPNITVTIEWTHLESNNAADTTTGSTVTSLNIPVTVTAEQII